MSELELENNMENMADQGEELPEDQKEQKTFTQEEVDKIVEKRLSRERKKFTSLLNGETPKEIELSEREKAVELKELRLDMGELLKSKNLPAEALELLDYTDRKSCEKSIDTLKNIVDQAALELVNHSLRGTEPPKRSTVHSGTVDTVRGAFGLDHM